MAFDPSVIGSIGERATAPVSEAPFKALQLSDLTQQSQSNQMTLNAQKQEQADLGYAKSYIDQNKLDISNPDDQAKLVAEVATRNPKMAMAMQRDFAQNDEAQVKLREEDLKYHAARMDTMALPAEHIVETMEDMARQGKGAQEIQAYGQKAGTELLSTLSKQSIGARPILTAEDKQEALKMLQGDVYQSLKSFVAKSKEAREAYSQYTKNQHEQAQTEAAGEKVETVMKGGKPHRVMFDSKGNEKKDLGIAPPTAALVSLQNSSGGDGDKSKLIRAAMADQGISFPPGMRSVKAQNDTLQGLMKSHPDDSPEQIAQRVKSGELGFKGSGVELGVVARREGASAAAINALNRKDGLYDQLLQTANKVDFGSNKLANAFSLYKQGKIIADPDISEYINALADTRAEFASVLARGGQVTDSVRIASEHAFPDMMSKSELQRNVERSRKIADAIQSGNTSVADSIIKGTPLEQALKQDSAPASKATGASPPSSSGAQGAGAGPKPYADAAKEARYQAWKKQHGG
jgi:hypothetical protein